jgi:hypothetical protein
MKTSSIWFAASALAVMTSHAQGMTLATPLVVTNGRDFPLCIATNVGTSDATVNGRVQGWYRHGADANCC